MQNATRFKFSLIKSFFIIFCYGISFFANSSNAGSSSNAKPETPTRIRSDIIDIKRKSQTINFLNNVVVEKDDSSMLAQKMTVIYEEDKSAAASEVSDESKLVDKKPAQKNTKIKRIDASKDVKIFTEEFIASGDIGHYEPENDVFILEKNVVVNNGTSIANGDKFIYNLKTKKGNFVGKKNEASINQDDDKRVVIVIGNDLKEQKKEHKNSKKNQQPKENEQDIKR